MATTPSTSQPVTGGAEIYYPTRDGRPMAETPVHGDAMIHVDQVLKRWFADDPNVYIGRNMMMYYVEGDPRKHVSPDVFVTFGITKDTPRDAYFTWQEGGRGPDLVIEVTSKSTRREDEVKKFALYRDVLQVREYFLFDPRSEYIKARLKGYRLAAGGYVPIAAIDGRLPSDVLELHLEPDGQLLQIFNPATGECLPTEAEAERVGRLRAERQVEELRRKIEGLQRQPGSGDTDDRGA